MKTSSIARRKGWTTSQKKRTERAIQYSLQNHNNQGHNPRTQFFVEARQQRKEFLFQAGKGEAVKVTPTKLAIKNPAARKREAITKKNRAGKEAEQLLMKKQREKKN